ncbi:branched-chain amino acid aminotransferase [Actinoplanes sp. NPDC051859]|uniref:branched-chain amino acid aminotransferase n=1 Tax=Actinoplanes sp. NPDC051859 TaxID=3363909 RepID=UPI0037A29205
MRTGLPDFAVRHTSEPLAASVVTAAAAAASFGDVFTEHMVVVDHDLKRGWHDARVLPLGPIELHPTTIGLHYGQSVFEGLKAYRRRDGGIAVFRPLANAARFRASARRLMMPELPDELFLASIEHLVRQDHRWVPDEPGRSLYLRPLLIATERVLALRPAREYRYLLTAFPMGTYFGGMARPVTVWVSHEFSRAAAGGTGAAKCAGNYAAGLAAQAQAAEMGCDQVVWLDAAERRFVEELGGMNLFFVVGAGRAARLVTPRLTGTILPGLIRDSVLRLAQDLGLTTEERAVTLDEWRRGAASGAVTETFACGTAAAVTPVGAARASDGEWTIGDGTEGPVTRRLRTLLGDVQHGDAPDRHGWMHEIVAPAA